MGIIPRSKFGNCSECGDENVNVVKVKKDLFCIHCRNLQKSKTYSERAEQRDKDRVYSSSEERQSLTNDLDFTFSRYIRIREADLNGICECYTCGKKDHWTKLQLGHYIKRGETLLRWDSRNAKVQCPECNCGTYGNMDVYTELLNKEQPGLPEQLKLESKEVNKYSREDLKQLLIDFRVKLRYVESKFKK
jgi:hypothetical protein